jgi:hypothetical protein
MAGVGMFASAAYAVFHTFLRVDGGSFVPKAIYIHVLFLFLAGVHVMFFPGNPVPPKADAKKSK